jgi:cytochrome c biogenesis protein CcdA
MLTSIHPLGERARDNRWSVTAAAYAAGSVAGGVVVGAGAGIAGASCRAVARPHMTTVAAVAALMTLTALAAEVARIPIPSARRQVRKEWMDDYRGWVYGAGFGFQLGLGVATTVTTATVYLAIALASLTGTVVGGAVVGGAFGLARAVPILAVRRVMDGSSLRSVYARFQTLGEPSRAASSVLLALVATAAAQGALRG